MIKGISPQGKYMYVNGGAASTTYISPGSVGAGMIRWNPSMNCLEVNDGNMWKMLDMSYATVGLNAEAESLLDWARDKRNEELEFKHMAKDHPAVAIALENLNKAQQQLKATVILSKEHQTNEESAS
jgi:hypothetical protein